MAVFSSMDFWLIPLAVLIAAVAVRGKFRARALLVTVALVFGCLNGLVDLGKKAVHRPRPNDSMTGVRMVSLAKVKPALLAIAKPAVVKTSDVNDLRDRGNSFPSGHTANNFAAAALIAAFYRRGWLMFIPAATVGYSRVYTVAHWPSDVVVTALLAIGLAWFFLGIFEVIWRRCGERWWPKFLQRHPALREVEAS